VTGRSSRTRIFDPFIDHWGDRSRLFSNRQDGAVDALATQYRGEAYDFWDDVLFAYLNIPGRGRPRSRRASGVGAAGRPGGYVFDVVRAEAGVRRGYPEIIQQADANAVLDTGAKTGSALVQEFADEHDLPIEWDAKAPRRNVAADNTTTQLMTQNNERGRFDAGDRTDRHGVRRYRTL